MTTKAKGFLLGERDIYVHL